MVECAGCLRELEMTGRHRLDRVKIMQITCYKMDWPFSAAKGGGGGLVGVDSMNRSASILSHPAMRQPFSLAVRRLWILIGPMQEIEE